MRGEKFQGAGRVGRAKPFLLHPSAMKRIMGSITAQSGSVQEAPDLSPEVRWGAGSLCSPESPGG